MFSTRLNVVYCSTDLIVVTVVQQCCGGGFFGAARLGMAATLSMRPRPSLFGLALCFCSQCAPHHSSQLGLSASKVFRALHNVHNTYPTQEWSRPTPCMRKTFSPSHGSPYGNALTDSYCCLTHLHCCLLLFKLPYCCLLLLFNSNNKNFASR